MCGIAGILSFTASQRLEFGIQSMTASLNHRGPDTGDIYLEDPIALGHRRLSIIDLSPTGNQPFTSANNRYKIVFNGELYNFQQVRKEIPDHLFQSTGDTEVLIEAWSRWQLDSLPKFKGMFAFGLWDRQEQALWLVRDRLGVKPLYYSLQPGAFLFASEINSLMASGMIKAALNHTALERFFRYQSVPGPDTMITGIKELKAGSWLKLKDGKIEQGTWWDLQSPGRIILPDNRHEAEVEILRLLNQSVQQRMVSDVPVAAFLSGGIDSSAVVALMSEISLTRPQTFNISFNEKEYDESRYAELLAKKFGTEHHTILQKPEYMLDNLFPALNALDTPSGDGINSYVVSKAISEAGIRVALSGIGGDELFGGYPFFRQFRQLQKFKSVWPVTKPFRAAAALFTGSGSSKKDRLKQLLQTKDLSITELYPVFRQIITPASLRKFLPASGSATDPVQQALLDMHKLKHFPEYSQVSIAEYLGYTQHTLLKDTDQMSMALSLEVREPFFDHELIEYVLQLPDSFKDGAYPKQLLVDSLFDRLPPEIVHRPKQGFVFPWEIWMKRELRSFCQSQIQELCKRDFINGKELDSFWKRFLKGDKSIRWIEIWLFVIISHWLGKHGL